MSIARAFKVPIYYGHENLIDEICRYDEIYVKSLPLDVSYVDIIYSFLLDNTPYHMTLSERIGLILKRLLLGPIAIPCTCDTGIEELLFDNCYKELNKGVHIYFGRECGYDGLHGKVTYVTPTHIIRGLMSAKVWEEETCPLLCRCHFTDPSNYVLISLPKTISISLAAYPHLLNRITCELTITEIDMITDNVICTLGDDITDRVCIHYKYLFNYKHIVRDLSSFKSFYSIQLIMFELDKIMMQYPLMTHEFFITVKRKLMHEPQRALNVLRLSHTVVPKIDSDIYTIKQLLTSLNLNVKYEKHKKVCSFIVKKTYIVFRLDDLYWRNLCLLYATLSTASDTSAKPQISVGTVYQRMLCRLRHNRNFLKNGMCRNFDTRTISRYPVEFAEVTNVDENGLCVTAFNTNRVINVKASLKTDTNTRSPRCLTHSFVMFKKTFKEPACTISTFASNGVNDIHSLNLNMRGSYLDFLFNLNIYRLHMDVDRYFLPASVCNSNSSIDFHGLIDQDIIRSQRSAYWTTNFPCMVTSTNNVNVGWFKAATAIIPRVYGENLRDVVSKETLSIQHALADTVDIELQQFYVALERRNGAQLPFLTKQFILLLRTFLLILHDEISTSNISDFFRKAMRKGAFDFSQNVVAHSKTKHTCAIAGSRLCNNIPKILVRRKKIKLDYFGRNANLLTFLQHIDFKICSDKQKKLIGCILLYLRRKPAYKRSAHMVQQIIRKLVSRKSVR